MNILIVRPDAIGDVVLITPLINSVKASYPNARIVTLQQRYTSELFAHHPHVDEVMIVNWENKGKTMLEQIKAHAFDMVFQPYLEPNFAALMVKAGIPIRVGDGNKLGMRRFLTHPVPLNFRDIHLHETQSNVNLLKGVHPDATIDMTMDLHMNPEEEADVKHILCEKGWDGEPLIAIHATTGGGNRAWNPYEYAKLMDLIQNHGTHRVVLTGAGKKDQEINTIIRNAAKTEPINMINAVSVDQLKWVIRFCDVVIGTDTGPTHMAAALGVKVLCVSPTKFVKSLRWGPWQTPNRIVGNPQKCPLVCHPYKCSESHCLDAISPDDVFSSLHDLLHDDDASFDTSQERWRKASVNVGIYCGSTNPEHLNACMAMIQDLKGRGYRLSLVASSQAVKTQLAYQLGPHHEIQCFSAWNLPKLLSFTTHRDINQWHVVPYRGLWYWKGLVRQLAALRLYVPPIILPVSG